MSQPRRPGHRKPERADGLDRATLATEVLAFLGADATRLSRFLDLTGSTPASLRQAAAGPGFADGVLAYLAADEAMLIEFAQASGHPPELIGRIAHREAGDPES